MPGLLPCATITAYLKRRFAVELDPKATSFHLQAARGRLSPLAFLDPTTGKDTVGYGTLAIRFETGALFANGKTHAVTLCAEDNFLLQLERIEQKPSNERPSFGLTTRITQLVLVQISIISNDKWRFVTSMIS